ncbi:MAG: rhodanese-like domain-containing protein [Firmicutes bacterium]|nr:rhodanese-like domain-containing protein [Bacillota bacterium]
MFSLKRVLTFGMVAVSILLAVGCSSGQVATQGQTDTQSGYIQSQPMQSQASYQNVNAAQAKQLIDSDKTLQIIDVREPYEYASGHIPGAKLIPVGEFTSRMGEIDKSRPVLVYCGVGSRSVGPSEVLAQAGYKVYNLTNGISEWTYEIEK